MTGLKSLVDNPLGVGRAANYFELVWKIKEPKNVFKHADSFLVGVIVQYGFLGVFCLFLFVLHFFRALYVDLNKKHLNVGSLFLGLLVLISGVRACIDVFSHGLWGYFFIILGQFYFIHNNSRCELK